MRNTYITFETPVRVAVVAGQKYQITDFKNNVLPLVVTPLRRDGKWWVCETNLGGIIHTKPAEFFKAL